MAEEKEIPEHAPGKHKIPAEPGKPNQKPITIRLGANEIGKYKVWKKPIPADAPATHNNKPITWINNFGVKKGNNRYYETTVPEYTIEVDAVSGKKLYYLDEQNRVKSLPHTVVGNKFEAKLTLGDPSIGIGG